MKTDVTSFDSKLNSEPANNRYLASSCEDVNNSLVNTSDSDIISNDPSPTSTIASSIIYEPKEINDSFNALIDGNKNEDDNFIDENIYDTVAPDEGDVVNSLTMANAVVEKEPEGDYVVFSETFESHQECPPPISTRSRTTDSLLSTQRSIEESPEYATYMNIDYFLQNQRRPAGKSDRAYSVGGDSDEEPFLGCSSDHEPEPDHVADYSEKKNSSTSAPTDDVFDMDSGVYSSSVESTSF
ncbi:active breakpoint cluster region-related protein [Caerostris extrusa]|uniref:Active breakpoint cluster region-related protein n=1 Tax=Caerostris extrusa TaxID=172846 RepID=A0AAV4QGP2_CAEEX|nr:active breakpoint cluster region-related protein [Caerostris extrusa]